MTEYFSNDVSSNVQSQTTNRPYKIISIEGNIGSGKSTLLNNLKEEYKYNPNVVFLDEPVDSWNNIKDSVMVKLCWRSFMVIKKNIPFRFR